MHSRLILPTLPSMPSRFPSLWVRCAISLFAIANLGTVLYVNLPAELTEGVAKWEAAQLSPQAAYQCNLAAWRVRWYGHITGLNNRWQMFGRQGRFNWWYVVRAKYSDGQRTEWVHLPIPSQSPRTLAQRLIFDLKERKFQLNIYNNRLARESYSRYLARQFPEHQGLPIESIRWELGYQNIIPPAEAVRQQKLVDPHCHLRKLDEFAVRESVRPDAARLAGGGK